MKWHEFDPLLLYCAPTFTLSTPDYRDATNDALAYAVADADAEAGSEGGGSLTLGSGTNRLRNMQHVANQ